MNEISANELISNIPEVIEELKNTPQDKDFHAEGNVWTHSQMVLDALRNIDEFKTLPKLKQKVLETACILHDIGKPKCTVIESDEKITSRNHSFKGSFTARNVLWNLGLNGDGMLFREAVCELISLHGMPAFFFKQFCDNESGARHWIYKTALMFPNQLFSIQELVLLSLADWYGRIGTDTGDGLASINLLKDISAQLGVYEKCPEIDDFSRFKFIHSHNEAPSFGMYNSTWGNVYIMSGLPGTGKSTYVKNNFGNLPVICLDQIRKETGTLPTDNQTKVVEKGFNDAKNLLREHSSFVWDAACLSKDIRKKLLQMCIDYKAFVKVIYLETKEETRDFRNHNREAIVPDEVIVKMRKRLCPPDFSEAHSVNWIAQ